MIMIIEQNKKITKKSFKLFLVLTSVLLIKHFNDFFKSSKLINLINLETCLCAVFTQNESSFLLTVMF